MNEFEDIGLLVELYIENKRALSRYYSLCIGIFPELAHQFSILSASKKDHGEFFKKIRSSMERHPYSWSMGGFDCRILQLLSGQINSNIENLLSQSPKINMIGSFINDIENSLAESEFYRALKTDIAEFEKEFVKFRNEGAANRKAIADILQKI